MDKYLKEGKTLVRNSIKKKKDDETTSTPPAPQEEIHRLNSDLSRSELKKVTKRKTLVHPVFYIKFFKGLLTFFKGCYFAIKTKPVMNTYLDTLKLMIIIVAGTYLSLVLLSFPLRLMLAFLCSFGIHAVEQIQIHFSPLVLFEKIAFFIPMVFIGFLRYVLPSYNEDMFFFVMAGQNKELAEFLKKSPIVKQYPLSSYLIRFAKLAAFGVIVYIGSMLPYLGGFVLAVSNFYYSYQPLGMGMAFSLSVLSLHPALKSHSAYVLKALMASYSLAKELLEVYYCRVPDLKQEVYINRRFFGWLFGFSIACMYALSIPYVGISLWGIAQGSAAVLVVRILERNNFKAHHNEVTIPLFGQEFVEKNDKE